MSTEIKCSKETLDFLLFSYFGITLEDASEPDTLIDIAINKAYLDATLQGAYNAMFTQNENETKLNEASKCARFVCTAHIKEELTKLPTIQEQTAFDTWHEEICKYLIKIYSEKLDSEKFFSYGNAQKWINMTMKYLYLMCGVFSGNAPQKNTFMEDIGDTIITVVPFFHVPVDSYIIEAVWNNENVKLPVKPEKTKRSRGKYASEKVHPWSQWNKPLYDEFRRTLQENVLSSSEKSSLIWESETWIQVAKERKKQAKKNSDNKNRKRNN